MKVMVYVDAENLAASDLEKFVKEVEEREKRFSVEGKVFGIAERSEAACRISAEEGFHFVETSAFSKGGRKRADVALVVECMTDVFIDKGIIAVWILSRDCDFKPLIAKLRGFGIRVEAPLLEQEKTSTVGDLGLSLRARKFDPMRAGVGAFYCQREQIRELLGEEFSDELIDKYLSKKKRNFLKGMRMMCDYSVVRSLENGNDFGFDQVVRIWKGDFSTLLRLAKLYTSKFYGLNFSDKENEQYVKELSCL